MSSAMSSGMSSGTSSGLSPLPGAGHGAHFKGLTEAEVELHETRHVHEPEMQPYREVKNLLWIKQNSVYSVALKEWDRKAKLLAERVDRMEKRIGDLKNETYQLAGFFSVFQGVVLTAVTQLMQSNDHTCKKVWSPVILSGLAWVVASFGVWQKLSRIEKLEYERDNEDEFRREAVGRARDLRTKGSAFKFSNIKEKLARPSPKKFRGYEIWRFWLNKFGLVFVTLSVFTGVFIASYFLIMCDRGLAKI